MCLAELVLEADRVHVIAHTDLDGLASAAIIARWARSKGKHVSWDVTGVRGLFKTLVSRMRLLLGQPGRSLIVVVDMAPRQSDALVYVSLVKPGKLELAWIDHHEWSSEVKSVLERAGVKVYVDRSDVTAMNVCRLLGCSDVVVRRLAELARYDDSCTPDPEGLVEKWRIVIRSIGFQELSRVIESLSKGDLWPNWADAVYKTVSIKYYESLRSTSKSVYEFEGLRVAVVTPPPNVSPCDLDLAGVLPGPREADVVVILYPRSISIRTWGSLNANCIARLLGGGGHRHAAGAPRPSLTMGSAQIARMVAKAAKECREGENASKPDTTG